MSTDGDLAFKPALSRRNLVEREIDSVSSCAINLDWDFNVRVSDALDVPRGEETRNSVDERRDGDITAGNRCAK